MFSKCLLVVGFQMLLVGIRNIDLISGVAVGFFEGCL